MKKTMRGYSWICLVAGLAWLACGQMEAKAQSDDRTQWTEPCTNECPKKVGKKFCNKTSGCGSCIFPTTGKPRLTLESSGVVIIQDTPVAFNPPKGAPLEFKMVYSSHGGMDYGYPMLDNGGGGWWSELGAQWTHSFRWSFDETSTDAYTMKMPDGDHVHFTYNLTTSNFFIVDGEPSWHSQHSSERYEAGWIVENGVSNILVRKAAWSTMECSLKQGCTTCGGNGGGNQSDVPHAPYSAWHASEGVVFTLTNGNYRLLRKISRDGEALTCNYNTSNLLAEVTNTLGDCMSFYYSYSNGIANARLTNIQVRHAGAVIRSASFGYDSTNTPRQLTSVTDMAANTFYFTNSLGYYPNGDGNKRIVAMSSPSSLGNGSYETITIEHGMKPDGSSSWTSDWTRVTYPEGDWRYVDFQCPISGGQALLIDASPSGTNITYYSEGIWGGNRIPTNIVDALGRVTQYDYVSVDSFLYPYLRAKINPDGTREEYDYTNEYQRVAAISYYTAPTNVLNERQLYQEEKWHYTDFSGVQCADVVTNEVWGLDRTNGWSLLSRKVTDYTRYDRGTGNLADDVYVLASEKRWIDANTFAETRYLYDTNTFLMTNVQQRTSSNGDFRTVQNFRWNQTNQLTEVVDALNYTNGVAYDNYYRVASTWQYRTNLVTRFTYDSLDQVLTKVYPDNTKEAWTYNSCLCGSVTYTNRDGSVTATIYDRNERPINRSTWTAVGTLLSSESYAYDYNGRITNTWDAASNVVESVYNAAGELINEIVALDRWTSYVYSDQSGQLLQTIRPDATYTSNRYDIAGRVMEVCQYDANTYPLATNQYGYDGMGRQVWTKDALGNVTSNEYDMLSRVIRTTYPDHSWSASGYDLLGNLIWQQQNGITTMTNTYDELNRRRASVNDLNPFSRTRDAK